MFIKYNSEIYALAHLNLSTASLAAPASNV